MKLYIDKINSKKVNNIIQIALIAFSCLILYLHNINLKVLGIVELMLIIQFIFSVLIVTIFFKNIVNVINVFIGTFFLFNFGRIILTTFGVGDYSEITWFAYYNVNYEVKIKVVLVCIFALQGLTLGTLNSVKFERYGNEYFEMDSDQSWFMIGKWLFIIFGVLNFIRIFKMISFTMIHGYMEYYSVGIKLSPILSISDDIFKFSFYLILLSNIKWEKMKKYIFIYFVSLIAMMMTGFRGFPMAEILSLILYIQYKNKKVISIKRLVVLVLILIISIFVIGSLRMGESLSKNLKNKNIIVDLINEQGYSLNVLSRVIENNNEIYKNDFEYLIYPFKEIFNLKEYTDSGMLNEVYNKSLAHSVSYYTNPEVYLSGGGMGGSYLGELYAGGGFVAVFVFNFILAYILNLFIKYMKKNRYLIYLWMFLIPNILIIPREYTLLFVLSLPRMLLFIIGVIIIRMLILKKFSGGFYENNNMC